VTYSRALANGGALTLLVLVWWLSGSRAACHSDDLSRSRSLSRSALFLGHRAALSFSSQSALPRAHARSSQPSSQPPSSPSLLSSRPSPPQDVRRTYRHRQYHSGRLRRGCERPRCRCRRRRHRCCCCVVVDFAHCVCVGQEEEQERPHAGARGRVRRQQPLLSACDQRVGT